MEEIWKPIGDSYYNYEASNLGRIRCVEQDHEEILEDSVRGVVLISTGLHDVLSLRRDRLIANAFIPKPTPSASLHHINGDTSDCRVENLEWVIQDGRTRTIEQYDRDGNFIREYIGIRNAHQVTGISYQGILNCCRGLQVSAGGYTWHYQGNKPVLETDPSLDPCPRCGGKAAYKSTGRDKYKVECIDCGIQTPICNSKKQASSRWNRDSSPLDSLLKTLEI